MPDPRPNHDTTGLVQRLRRWVLVTGGRPQLALGVSLGIGLLTAVLVVTGVVYVGPDSNLATVLSSGMLSALATVVAVTLSINQLILSRVFGTPSDLTDRMEGNLEFRRTIEDVAGVDVSPNTPSDFLVLLAETLAERAEDLERAVADADVDDELHEHVDDLVDDLVEYADHLGGAEDSERTYEVLLLTFGTTYADRIQDVRALRRTTGDAFGEAVGDQLDDILELLKGVAVVRQFFKTLALQQDLASLSRQLIYTGLTGLLAAFYLAQVYTPPGTAPAIATPWLPWVVVAGAAVVFSPIAVLVSTLLRVATVTLYTVSVGSFVPPEERIGET